MPQPATTVTERRLGTWPIFVIAVSAMTPLTVVAGALPLGYGQVEEKGIPVAYMLVAAVLGVFAVGLAAMARHVPNSGAFYAYAAAGLSRPAGVGTAFVALLAYNAMQIGLYGAFGVAAHHVLAAFGVEISWVIWALLGWALIAVLGRLNIDLNARILTVLVCAEVLIVLILDAVMLANPAGGTVTFDTLNPALIASAGGVALLVAAIAGMVGFEAPLVYAAEAKDPRRTIARAIGFTLLVAAVLYGGTAWVMSVVAGPDQIIVIAADHLDDLFFFLPEPYLPAVVIDLARVFFATSLFAAMLAFHHTVARYALTVAREGVLPGSLARTRDDVPVTASLAQSGLAVAVLLIFAVAGWNPTTDLFFFGTVSGGLGVLVLMAIAAVAVVRYFRADDHGESRWRRSIAPWIALVFLVLILLLTVASFGILLDSDNLVKVWTPPLAFLLLFLLGVYWGRRLRHERPEVYAGIGSGLPPSPAAAAVEPQRDADQIDDPVAEPRGDIPGTVAADPATATSNDAAARAVSTPATRTEASGEAAARAQKTGSPAPEASPASSDVAAGDPASREEKTPGSGPAGLASVREKAGDVAPGEPAGREDEAGAARPAPPRRASNPRKQAATGRRATRPPADGPPATSVPGEAVEATPPNGASGEAETVRRPRTPRARRAPGRGAAEPPSGNGPTGSAHPAQTTPGVPASPGESAASTASSEATAPQPKGTASGEAAAPQPFVSDPGSPSVQVSGSAQISAASASSSTRPDEITGSPSAAEPATINEPTQTEPVAEKAQPGQPRTRAPRAREANPDAPEETP
ncbi:APC family permease [Actinoplanes aureus]|uniref:Amino acid permease n=1 Tax=Actinoplanes aureus TaxID=2792083 RepID=A0A931CCH2_9ACTN|nr:APC family permease [Actinoplanes aureus]MBG0564816.1 amino acid permease [Actinoplanes aureus]